MNSDQLNRMKNDKGFIAALDQSGGSTPKALAAYGVTNDAYHSEDEMYRLVHQMRTRMMTNPAFNSASILGAILFKQTMRSLVEGLPTADYLWEHKGIVPFLKVDNGLADLIDGVQIMKPMPDLPELLQEAAHYHIFGTKMRSVIKENNEAGIRQVVDQQFSLAKRIIAAGLLPIVEPEVDIHAPDKLAIEHRLRTHILQALDELAPEQQVMLKLTIPTEIDFYNGFIEHPRVVRVVALSGGYSRDEAVRRLAQQHGLIASFSRALSEGLRVDQSDEEFGSTLQSSIRDIVKASET